MRRVAASIVFTDARQRNKNYVVEVYDNIVVNHYPLLDEQPMTEWLGGMIVLTHFLISDLKKVRSVSDFYEEKEKNGKLRNRTNKLYAYHISSIDLTSHTFSDKSVVSMIVDKDYDFGFEF